MPRTKGTHSQKQLSARQKTNAADRNRLLTVPEVAQHLRVDSTTVRRWISLGVLDAVALPHKGKRQAYRIKQQTLNHLLKVADSPAALENAAAEQEVLAQAE